jgi:hypothetical protein
MVIRAKSFGLVDCRVGLGVQARVTAVPTEVGRHRRTENNTIWRGDAGTGSGSGRDSHTSRCVTSHSQCQRPPRGMTGRSAVPAARSRDGMVGAAVRRQPVTLRSAMARSCDRHSEAPAPSSLQGEC